MTIGLCNIKWRMEAKHPGLALTYAPMLGSKWIDATLNMTTEQAILLGKYADEIAELPSPLKNQLLDLCMKKTDEFFKYVGDFVKKNPGKVLFTAASTATLLANSKQIFGTSTSVPGNHNKGLVGTLIGFLGESFMKPIQVILYGIGAIIGCVLALRSLIPEILKILAKRNSLIENQRANAESDPPTLWKVFKTLKKRC